MKACMICALNTLKWNAGQAYVVGAAMAERGLHFAAVACCELHKSAVADVYPGIAEAADEYEKGMSDDEA